MNQKIRDLVNIAIDLNFDVHDNFYDMSDDQLAKIYNGCGPDWLLDPLRDMLTDYYSFFEAAFVEHDVSFHLSDKSKKEFKAANKRLHRNCKKLASQLSWWKNPVSKIRRYRQAWILYKACQKFGWSAWIA